MQSWAKHSISNLSSVSRFIPIAVSLFRFFRLHLPETPREAKLRTHEPAHPSKVILTILSDRFL